jgi:hypothetical protein
MVSEKEVKHLQKYADFLGAEIKRPYKNKQHTNFGEFPSPIRVAIADKVLVPKVVQRLGLTGTRKTYNPISLDVVPEEFATSFLVGFIDGDGSITENGYLRIENHKAWKSFHEQVCIKYPEFHFTKGKPETSLIACGKSGSKKLKEHALAHNLPILDRKWSRLYE